MVLRVTLFLGAIFVLAAAEDKLWISLDNEDSNLQISQGEATLTLVVTYNGTEKLAANIGNGLSLTNIVVCPGVDDCLLLESNVRLHVTVDTDGFKVLWSTSDTSKTLQDCFNLSLGNWYGGPEWRVQSWPIEKLKLSEYSFVTKNDDQIAVVEPYWLNSLGGYIHVNERVPLFVDQNNLMSNFVCFIAKASSPYLHRERVLLQYSVAAHANPKEAHRRAVENHLGKPTGHPRNEMIEKPIFSTWARYYRDINDELIRNFSSEILDNGYAGSQLEIDDKWEFCYGALRFDPTKFPNASSTVEYLQEKNFRVTFWTHPFINVDCNYSLIGNTNNFFVKDSDGKVTTTWWNSNENMGQYLDFTNEEVREWFYERLSKLRDETGLDGYKFDAGETSWSPQVPELLGDPELHPNQLTSDYVRTCAQLGDLGEVRSAWRTQDLPIFVRMIDKDSNWGDVNGLYTLVTTLLQMNMVGYTMVLPDMVGGNGYDNERPDGELFVRWLQANTFMPAIQFSIVPWDFDDDFVVISKKYVDLHEQYASTIIEAMERSIADGSPVNPPIWWVDPEYDEALKCDTEYLLGETILVAPILEKGAESRDIVLPQGSWRDPSGTVHEGRQILQNFSAPLDTLPYFIRIDVAQSGATSLSLSLIAALFAAFISRFL